MSLWTPEHAITLLPALVGMILLAVLLRKMLGNRDWKIRMIPVQILAVVLLLLEVGKQAVSLWRGYDLTICPSIFAHCLFSASRLLPSIGANTVGP